MLSPPDGGRPLLLLGPNIEDVVEEEEEEEEDK
jgi:hypothetical protein